MKFPTHFFLLGSAFFPTSFSFVILTQCNHGIANKIAGVTKTGAAEVAINDTEESVDEYSRFGVAEEDVAMGVDMNDLLQWVGTKEDIIERVMKDNTNFSHEKAEEETNKIMMDAEVLGRLVFYEKNKDEIIRRQIQEDAESLSNPNTLATYAAWLAGGASFPWFRRKFIDPQFESGPLSDLHIQLPKIPFLGGGSDAVNAVTEGAASSSISSTVETVSETISVAQAILDGAPDSLAM